MKPKPLLAAALFSLAVGLYLSALDYPFQFDDDLHLRDENVVEGRWRAFVWPPVPRAPVWLTFVAQRRWSADPAFFRSFNLAVHGLNAILAFLILLRLQDRAAPDWIASTAAFAGAALFALHPLQSEAVLLVYQRSTLLAAFFAFLGLLFWTRRDRTAAAKAATLVCFLLSLACKEFMAVFPLALWCHDGLIRRDWRPRREILAMLVAGLAAVVVYLSSGGAGAATYALTQVRVWGLYGLLIVGAIPQNVDHMVMAQSTLWDPRWWVSLAAVAIGAGLAWRIRSRFPEAAFGAALFGLFLLPTSSFVPSPDFIFEHRVYASMLGVACVAAWGLAAGLRRRLAPRPALIVFAVLVLALSAHAAHRRGQVWSDPVTLWRDASEKSPAKYRPRYNLGVALMESDWEEAEKRLSEAVAINPSQPLAYRALGRVKLLQGDRRAARGFWEQARILDPEDWPTWAALGGLHLLERDYHLASERLAEAARLAPREAEPHLQLSRLNLLFGFVKEAIQHAQAGLEWNPDSTPLLLALADAVSADKNWARAEELHRRVLEIDPRLSAAYFGLALALDRQGRSREALEAARQGRDRASTAADREWGDRLLRQFGER